MRIVWKIFRACVSVVLLLALLLPASLYVLLSIAPVQNKIRNIAATELSETLGADVKIGKVIIHPFNRLSVIDAELSLDGDRIAQISNISAGFELYHLLRTGELEIDYALIDKADFHITKETPSAPLNIQAIIEHLRSDKPRQDKAFELKINTVILRNANLYYDILSEPYKDNNQFDAAHIAIRDLAVNAFIPRISNSQYSIHLDHLSFTESSGFTLKSLRAKVDFADNGARIYDFNIDLPASHLAFDPIALRYNGFDNILPALHHDSITLQTSGINTISPADFKAFLPIGLAVERKLFVEMIASGSLDEIKLHKLSLRDSNAAALSVLLQGEASNLTDNESFSYSLNQGVINIDGTKIAPIVNSINAGIAKTLATTGAINANISANGTFSKGNIKVATDGAVGAIAVNGSYSVNGKNISFTGNVDTESLNLGILANNDKLGIITAHIDGKATKGYKTNAKFDADIDALEYNGYIYSNIEASADILGSEKSELKFSLDDPNIKLLLYALYNKTPDSKKLEATAITAEADLFALGFDKKHQDYKLGAKLNIDLSGNDIDNLSGMVQLSDLRWVDRRFNGLKLKNFNVDFNPDGNPATISIDSDIIKGNITGDYSLSSLKGQLSDICEVFIPALFEQNNDITFNTKKKSAAKHTLKHNNFDFDFTLLKDDYFSKFFEWPVQVIYNIDISGHIDSQNGVAKANINAPYLLQGNKLIEQSNLYVSLDTTLMESSVYVTTKMPTKKGDMAIAALVNAADNRLDTKIDWTIERAIPLNGTIDFSTLIREGFKKNTDDILPINALVSFNPGTINFGDDVWQIHPTTIDITHDKISIDGVDLEAGKQQIAINGTVSDLPSDSLDISLRNVALLPIFETLEIDKALIGGRATGDFTAKNLLGKEPSLICPVLHVDSIGYQRCTIGDADILALWDNEKQSFFLDADITGLEGRKSYISGDIFPFTESLDISFDADSVPVGFLKPFMDAFTSDISGRATGHCRLFGTFKEIDLEGDVFANDVKIKVDFTGTSYLATDSVHLRPGRIDIKNIMIRDTEGNTASLNGWVGHKYFKEPTFRFDVTQARNLLCYNTKASDNPDWYGKIYGSGTASISGQPGVVNINVAMTTTPGSSFTFVLSDRLDAEDYSFITFRDITPDSLKTSVAAHDNIPKEIKDLKANNIVVEESSLYNMDIRVDVTRDATMILVMDPIGGDEIKAHGEGNLRLSYQSANNDLNMWGKYAISDGSYRFTLQDIIIKDFTIKEGSQIQFDGDPYAVKTQLNAFYATNANLSDLDESFLQDKEVARTNVPVHALMNVSGDIRQPAIDFDLEFPTLSQDTYRKVRSIVSTSDMMNQQIIYLLALNRFYTPDYMASTTKGSELFSVASSTISSQLSSMLGKLSDNWSIAPNLRSDRGDFSDVEVDVALSSRLLNNRLLFNGNFGYRDKSLNTNQFIGDFDIEYLLNKRGTWRLKAYNRYNDRNYYIRSAQTTQGIGILFRHDFD
ncbi:MAG: translocation/assembly module TamB domain-containing protein [Muribaculaceae bacterium]|nr:translocation/assembly module TamB domain-containing protein [Muribaculaceae bacterium]